MSATVKNSQSTVLDRSTVEAGTGQTRRNGYSEPPIVTLGADLDGVAEMLSAFPAGWTAAQAVEHLLGGHAGPE
jgi:hypothetical protein